MESEPIEKIGEDLTKALGHLDYSAGKATRILAKAELEEDDLESLEGLGARFARASDIGIQKFLRGRVLENAMRRKLACFTRRS